MAHGIAPKADQLVSLGLDATGEYEVPNQMLHGFQFKKDAISHTHPLEHSEAQWASNKQHGDGLMLRNTQGLHAPLRLEMERSSALKIGRLPCLRSSNLMHDTLTGKLDTIEFSDFLNTAEFAEEVGDPHTLMEKRLGLL